MASIEKLKKRVALNKETRDIDKKFSEHLNARKILVNEAPSEQEMDFYCKHCNTHTSSLGKKRIRYGIELDENFNVVGDYMIEPISALFVSRCPKGHCVERYITDKEHDPYFKSPILLRMAYEMADELLQPSDPRFKKVYPKQWEELQRQNYAY